MKNIIKIPDYIALFYCSEKSILTVIGPMRRKSIKLKLKINIIKTKKHILVSKTPVLKITNAEKKRLKSVQGTAIILIKQIISEASHIFYQKLKFVGVGYRALKVDDLKNKVMLLKLGYSHPIYFRIPPSYHFCLKKTKLFLCGKSYKNLTQLTSLLRSLKKPEPYKGKGILYENEKIALKEGKKV